MKKVLSLLFVTILVAGFYGCSKDSVETSNKKKIAGKWFVTTIKTNQYKNNTWIDADTTNYSDKSAYIQFNSDATGRTQDGAYGYDFSYSINGSDVTLTNIKIDGNADGTIDVSDVPTVMTITAINSSKLSLHSEITYKILSDNYKESSDMSLSK